ncbi:phosphatidylinositol transfer protein SFH5 [Myxozyma melibiosi]|uniref:Phosphatidylinositol transfer protein SFH5 n=1 Tax=Myxozyma melibiosi TaxID=54550 RepID=A0ABR1FFI4_9ASCO
MTDKLPAFLAALTPEQLQGFNDFKSAIPAVVKEAEYSEIYAHNILATDSAAVDAIILKFLVANAYDVPAARAQILGTLKWRKEFKPLSAAFEEVHDAKFDGLGYITEDKSKPNGDIVTWNLYGQAAGKPEVVFGDTEQFLRWRVGVMERGLQLLDFASERTKIDQVHDYMNVSFLRMDPNAKKASKAAVAIFSSHYPELLGRKLFINVPLIMGWMFAAMKLLVSRETMAKFVVLSYGSQLVDYLGPGIPEVYGGKGQPLKEQDIYSSITLPAGFTIPIVEAAPEPATTTDAATDVPADAPATSEEK